VVVAKIIDRYLEAMVTKQASDLYVTCDCPPSFRVEGDIVALDVPPMTAEDIRVLVNDLVTEDQLDEFDATLELNLATSLASGHRFRVNLFMQKNQMGMVVRFIKSVIPQFSELGLPNAYAEFVMQKRGLLLMVGSTGSGKSTSLAAMIDFRNKNSSGHIVTVEDPIEFYHAHQGCIVTQREIGIDTYSYGIALKNALRQSPDLVMIGEIRDRETLENAILFCETGHLVVATLHANNSNQAIDRMVNLFPEDMQKQILQTLAQNLNVIISQRLVRKADEQSRVCAYEVMINEGYVTNLIEEGRVKTIKEVMEKNRDHGMITFDQCLFEMYKTGVITSDIALVEADNPGNLRLRINQEAVFAEEKPLASQEVLVEGEF
jgi:twitching motility protein PilU